MDDFEEMMDSFLGREIVDWDADDVSIFFVLNDGSGIEIAYDEEVGDIVVAKLEPEHKN